MIYLLFTGKTKCSSTTNIHFRWFLKLCGTLRCLSEMFVPLQALLDIMVHTLPTTLMRSRQVEERLSVRTFTDLMGVSTNICVYTPDKLRETLHRTSLSIDSQTFALIHTYLWDILLQVTTFTNY